MACTDPNAALKIDYADLGVSTGYIGNIERFGDERSFRVFTKLSTKPFPTCCDVSVHVFDVPRGHKGVWNEAIQYDTPEIRARLDRIRERFQRGELHAVQGHTWQEKAAIDAAAGRVPS